MFEPINRRNMDARKPLDAEFANLSPIGDRGGRRFCIGG
jgi:hypothetical protein